MRISKALHQFDQLLLAIANIKKGNPAQAAIALSLTGINDPVVKNALGFKQKTLRDINFRNNREAIVKAAVAAGTTTDGTWADPLMAFQSLADAFFESLTTVSLLDAILDRCRRIPIGVQIQLTTAIGAGYSVGETVWAPATKFEFDNTHLSTLKAESLVILTNEMLRFMTGALLRTELQKACALAADAVVLPILLDGLSLIASSGDARTDLRELAAAVPIKQSSQLLWLTSPAVVAQLALMGGDNGARFADVGIPGGGSIANVPLLGLDVLSDYSTDGTLLMLVDASQIAGDSGTIVLDASDQTSINMTDTTGQNGALSTVSMFQTSSTALSADREFTLTKIRDNCVACVKNVNYSATSP